MENMTMNGKYDNVAVSSSIARSFSWHRPRYLQWILGSPELRSAVQCQTLKVQCHSGVLRYVAA